MRRDVRKGVKSEVRGIGGRRWNWVSPDMDNIFVTMIKGKFIWMTSSYLPEQKKNLHRSQEWYWKKLWENDLFLKSKKCKFCKTKIEYLGMIIEEGRISIDPVKLRGIRDWLISTMSVFSCTANFQFSN